MNNMDVKLREDLLARVKKLVKEKRYDSIDAFLNSAAETLLMAEDRVGMFRNAITRKTPEETENKEDAEKQ